jgi:Leucine-rich repeat (LRR) protein
LKNLKSLSLLDFSGNKVKGVEPLRGLTTLETVIATNNVIVSLEPLKDMPKLTLLQIGSNPIVTLAPLSNMFALQVLGAESCSYLKGEWDRVLLCANALKKANFTNTPIDWVPTYVDKAKNDAAFQARFPNLELLTVSEGRKLAQVGGNPIQLSDLKEKK